MDNLSFLAFAGYVLFLVRSLGLLSSEPVALVGTPLDALCDKLSQDLVYGMYVPLLGLAVI